MCENATEPGYDPHATVDFWVAGKPDESRLQARAGNIVARLRPGTSASDLAAIVAAATAPAGDLEVVDVSPDGANVAVTLGTVGSSASSDQYELTMRPTNTGYFLICDQPLSEADLSW